MIGFFKNLMEQVLDLELTVRFTKRDGAWFAALGDELDSLSPEELEEYRAGLKVRLCDAADAGAQRHPLDHNGGNFSV